MLSSCEKSKNAFRENTAIGVVITNACLTKPQAGKIASFAQNGFATTIKPAHTMFDGDTIFTMGSGEINADINTVGILAKNAVEKAVVNAIKKATPLHGIMAYSSFFQ